MNLGTYSDTYEVYNTLFYEYYSRIDEKVVVVGTNFTSYNTTGGCTAKKAQVTISLFNV